MEEITTHPDDEPEIIVAQMQEAIKGCELLNFRNRPDEFEEHVNSSSPEENVLKEVNFEKKQAYCADKVRSLWMWRIMSLILGVGFVLIYIHTRPAIHHKHVVFSWNVE
uniref:AsIV-cont00083-ORF1 n=1 Tax=Apophua simplicipes ichnovirus TaxID=1329648 RepID=S5DMM2_9VIRU|nr:AsIV-cont00083-ORF1 [Apophua simplicipes ichnovirus]